MALLTFPFPVADGTVYPVSPPAGTNVYQWSSTDQTWILLGKSTGVAAGTYGTPLSVPQITVDATGRITVAVDVPIQLGDTTQVGLVQLVDDLISNDPTKALTAAQGFVLSNEIGDTSLLNPFYPNLVTAVNALGAPSGVTSGTYGNSTNIARFTVNAQGRITSATNVPLALATTISPGVIRVGANLNVTPTGVLSVPNSSTTVRGAVQLVNDTVTNDNTKALTAAQGYDLQLQIDALEARNNLTFAGTIDGATGLMLTVTAQGAALGFVVANPLPAPTLTNNEYFVVVTVPGTFTPTGGAPQACNDGDWFVSDGSQWLYYNVGPTVAAATFIQLDDISGQFNGTRTAFTLRVSGVAYTPVSASAILLSVGGVIQVPGNSFTLSGSTVTFSEAPRANTTFVGYAVSGMTGGGGGGGGGGTGTVTSVATGTGLIGGPVTTTGTISLRPATNSTLGGVQPDNTTISVSPTGVISVIGSGAGNLQTVTDNGSVTTRSITVGGLASTGTTTLGDASSDLIYFLGRVATSFLPNVTEAYDLGSPTQRWKDLYVSSNSIYMGANKLTVSGGQLLINGTPVGGGGSVGTLQQVTTAGNTTTNLINFVDPSTNNVSIQIDPDANQISWLPESGAPGCYINSGELFFLDSGGSVAAGGLFAGELTFDGAAGTNIKTKGLTTPVQLWAGGLSGIPTPQVSVTGTSTTITNQLIASGNIHGSNSKIFTTGGNGYFYQGSDPSNLSGSSNGAAMGYGVLGFQRYSTSLSDVVLIASYQPTVSETVRLTVGGDFFLRDATGNNEFTVTGTGNVFIKGSLQASGLTYPTTDGTSGQVLTTNGAGILSWTTAGGGSVGTLQQVTDAGATTTRTMTVTDGTNTASIGNLGVSSNSTGLQANLSPGRLQLFGTQGVQLYSSTSSPTLTLSLDSSTGRATVASLVASGLRYPTTDGTSGQVLTTNGAGVLSWASGSGAVSTLQQVTTAGNTTTDSIRLFDSGTSNEAITLDPLNGVISILPQGVGQPGLYLSPNGATIGNSVGSFSSAGLFPCELKFNGSAGAALKTYDASYPVQLWAGGTNLVGAPQLSVTGTATTLTNQIQAATGSTASPSISFASAPTTGFNANGGNLEVSFAGSSRMVFSGSGTGITGNLTVNGYVKVPSNGGVQFTETSGTSSVYLNPPANIPSSYSLTLPSTDGTADQVLATDGTGDLQWLTTAKIVAVPANSGSGGAAGQIAFGNGFFYWFNTATNQWLRVAGSTF